MVKIVMQVSLMCSRNRLLIRQADGDPSLWRYEGAKKLEELV